MYNIFPKIIHSEHAFLSDMTYAHFSKNAG